MGTCHWMAPEVISSDPYYTLAADVYSFGIVIWEILTRETPYREITPLEIPTRVLHRGERPNLSLIPSSCPIELRNLMIECWSQSPMARPSFDRIIEVLENIRLSE